LTPHYDNILKDPWRGIPELTDKDSKYCKFSCRTQAWSIAMILEGLEKINN
jgi:glycogen debranching enzyme